MWVNGKYGVSCSNPSKLSSIKIYPFEVHNFIKFPLMLMGVLAPQSMHTRPSPWPNIDMREKISAHMQSHLQTSPPTPHKSNEVLEPYDIFSKYPPFPPNLFWLVSNIFVI